MVSAHDIQWGVNLPQRLVRLLQESFVSRVPQAPVKLPEFIAAELPDAARWRWCLVAVTDRNCAALSNGVTWVRSDGSAL